MPPGREAAVFTPLKRIVAKILSGLYHPGWLSAVYALAVGWLTGKIK
jgi:hypothetical protein